MSARRSCYFSSNELFRFHSSYRNPLMSKDLQTLKNFLLVLREYVSRMGFV